MSYIEFEFNVIPEKPGKEILLAELMQFNFDSFLETETSLKAYIQIDKIDFDVTTTAIFSNKKFNISFVKRNIKEKNWNALWEKNIEPVIINKNCIVKNSSVILTDSFNHEIIINPKMSFGTGHHETTVLMLSQMFNLDFKEKNILDVGCGTGILSILASKIGSLSIIALDVDKWAIKNALENVKINNCKNINVKKGTIEVVNKYNFDIILVNINKNVLLKELVLYESVLSKNGFLLLSGFYTIDNIPLKKKAELLGLKLKCSLEKNTWSLLQFQKK